MLALYKNKMLMRLKEFLVLVILVLSIQKSISQTAFGPMKTGIDLSSSRNVLYVGIDNDMHLNTGLPIEKWEAKTSNGTTSLWGMGDVQIRPDKPGKDSIDFYFTNEGGEKKLGLSVILPVQALPPAQVILGKNNKIKLVDLLSLKALPARIINTQYYLPYFIQQCKIVIIKTTGQRSELTQTGNVLTADITKVFQTLKHGDLIIIQDAKGVRDKSEAIENIDGAFVSID